MCLTKASACGIQARTCDFLESHEIHVVTLLTAFKQIVEDSGCVRR